MRLTRRALFAGIAGIFGAKALPTKRPPRYGDREIARLLAAIRRLNVSINEACRILKLKPIAHGNEYLIQINGSISPGDFATKDLTPLFKKLEAKIDWGKA